MQQKKLRTQLHEIIFEADTKEGKLFDVILLILIVASVITVMLETIERLNARYHDWFVGIEWFFTILFTIEYILRLYCVHRPTKYATSFYGIVDLLAVLPTYLEILISGSHYLAVIRALRLMRIFRIFKLGKYLQEGGVIVESVRASRRKITVFLTFVFLLVIIIGSLMYVVEGGADSGFTSIPKSVYWAIVTLTTVGYGDIHPVTDIGQILAALVMISGYSVLAVPTGIISAEVIHRQFAKSRVVSTQTCRYCTREGHDIDAQFCKYCGENLNEEDEED